VQVLVLNSGSSSIKYQVFDHDLTVLATGLLERIGEAQGRATHRIVADDRDLVVEEPIADHEVGFARLVAVLEEAGVGTELGAIGHRVVHGGD
jgi:acetate kinase